MRSKPASPATTCRLGMLQCVLLLSVATAPLPGSWESLKGLVDSARSPELNRAERAAGYYEGLISGQDATNLTQGEPSMRLLGKPPGWVRFQEADVVRYLQNDFLQFELKPSVKRVLFGQPFTTNTLGMHDLERTIEKPPGTFRVVVLGSSIDMGWGVSREESYVGRLETWLAEHASRKKPTSPRRFEVLNLAVAAYSPLQRLETLTRKALQFQPDLVLYSATTLDTRLLEIHLRELLHKKVDLKFDFVKRAIAESGIDANDLTVDSSGHMINKERLKAKLKPFYWSIYDDALGAIAAECRSAAIPLEVVIIPRVGKSDSPKSRAGPVAMLKAIAGRHGLSVHDLSNAFDKDDASALEIAAWDDHPNALGHRRLFVALAKSLVNDPEQYGYIFGEPGAPERTR